MSAFHTTNQVIRDMLSLSNVIKYINIYIGSLMFSIWEGLSCPLQFLSYIGCFQTWILMLLWCNQYWAYIYCICKESTLRWQWCPVSYLLCKIAMKLTSKSSFTNQFQLYCLHYILMFDSQQHADKDQPGTAKRLKTSPSDWVNISSISTKITRNYCSRN